MTWREQRADRIAEITERAEGVLLDRTVVHVAAVPHDDDCDSANVLRLTLDNGDVVEIEGTYGGYTGHSCDEYLEVISIERMPLNLRH